MPDRPPSLDPIGPVVVATWSWKSVHQAWSAGRLTVWPVRISRGTPKFWAAAQGFEYMEELAPDGWMMGLADDDPRFERGYRRKLDAIGPTRIRQRLQEISLSIESGLAEAYGPASTFEPILALCCYEADPAKCHRTIFRAWFEESTGVDIQELEPYESDNQQLSFDGGGTL